MKVIRNLGLLLLAAWLILTGLIPLLNFSFSGLGTVMAILAYIGPLIIASYLLAKDDEFVKFHIKQGLVLVIGEVASWMIAMMIWPI